MCWQNVLRGVSYKHSYKWTSLASGKKGREGMCVERVGLSEMGVCVARM